MNTDILKRNLLFTLPHMVELDVEFGNRLRSPTMNLLLMFKNQK